MAPSHGKGGGQNKQIQTRTMSSFVQALRDDMTTTTGDSSSIYSPPTSQAIDRVTYSARKKGRFPATGFEFGNEDVGVESAQGGMYVSGIDTTNANIASKKTKGVGSGGAFGTARIEPSRTYASKFATINARAKFGTERQETFDSRFKERFSRECEVPEENFRYHRQSSDRHIPVAATWDDIRTIPADAAFAPPTITTRYAIDQPTTTTTTAGDQASIARRPSLVRRVSNGMRKALRPASLQANVKERPTISSPYNFHDYSPGLPDHSVPHAKLKAVSLAEAQTLPQPERGRDGLVKRAGSLNAKTNVYVETYNRARRLGLKNRPQNPPPPPNRPVELTCRKVIGDGETSTVFGDMIDAANHAYGQKTGSKTVRVDFGKTKSKAVEIPTIITLSQSLTNHPSVPDDDLFSNPSAVPEPLFKSKVQVPSRKPIRKLADTSTYSWIPPPSSDGSPSSTATKVVEQWHLNPYSPPSTRLEAAFSKRDNQEKADRESSNNNNKLRRQNAVKHTNTTNLNVHGPLPRLPPDAEPVIDTFDH